MAFTGTDYSSPKIIIMVIGPRPRSNLFSLVGFSIKINISLRRFGGMVYEKRGIRKDMTFLACVYETITTRKLNYVCKFDNSLITFYNLKYLVSLQTKFTGLGIQISIYRKINLFCSRSELRQTHLTMKVLSEYVFLLFNTVQEM